MTLILVLVLSSVSCGATSDDVYVRKDVYQSDMRRLDEKLDQILVELKEQRKDINELAKTVSTLSERIEGVNKSLTEKIDDVDKKLSARIDDLRNGIYLISTLITVIIALPFVKKWYEEHKAAKTKLTLEEVKVLIAKAIEENNVMLFTKIQGGMNK